MHITNLQFNTRPQVVHAQGSHSYKPHWRPILDAFFAEPPRECSQDPALAVLTCNNGAEGMGILEKSLDHLGIRYIVAGQKVREWINSRHKPLIISELLRSIENPYVLYADSRDAIVLNAPQLLLSFFKARRCGMIFSADRMNWPPLRQFLTFEESIPEAQTSDFRFLNGGVWIGETRFCREFFDAAVKTSPCPEAPESEQGILKQLFPRFFPTVQLDYRCEMFQNIGFVGKPIFKIESESS